MHGTASVQATKSFRTAIAITSCSAKGRERMTDTDQIDEDEVLKRMLSTPPKPHKPAKESSPKKKTKKQKG